MVDILLATFNGGKFISDQIDSILCQTYNKWRLYISDDCSNDNTVGIIQHYVEKYPDKIFLIQNQSSSGSAKNHFFKMMRYSTSKYTMFCDHDDVWMPEKIKTTLEKMIKSEKLYGDNMPLLVHTDLMVVDERLKILSKSMFQLQALDYRNNKLNNLLVQNIVTGCTMMVNRKLMDLVNGKIPDNAIMHDWWLALVASAFGQIVYINEPMILYRQHSNNEVGAKSVKNFSYILHRVVSGKIRKSIEATYFQAECFRDIYGQELNYEKKEIISNYIELPVQNKLKRIMSLYKYGFLKSSTARKIGQVLYI